MDRDPSVRVRDEREERVRSLHRVQTASAAPLAAAVGPPVARAQATAVAAVTLPLHARTGLLPAWGWVYRVRLFRGLCLMTYMSYVEGIVRFECVFVI